MVTGKALWFLLGRRTMKLYLSRLGSSCGPIHLVCRESHVAERCTAFGDYEPSQARATHPNGNETPDLDR
jgi:hypothetical protein